MGIAHLGAIAALEERGHRFVGLAGASAGAIAVTLMAACRSNVQDPCAERLRDILADLPASDFVDGPTSVRRFLKRLVPPRALSFGDLALLPGCVSAVRTLSRRMGLNSGNAFSHWLDDTLRREFGVVTLEDLRARVKTMAVSALKMRGWDRDDLDPDDFLALTTTTLPVGLRLILPRHLEHFDVSVHRCPPADLVRASMSVPGFFEPVVWRLSRNGHRISEDEDFRDVLNPRDKQALDDADRLALVDGGLLSNFPVDAFTAEDHPCSQLPTIGILLSPSVHPVVPARGLRAVVRGGFQMVGAARAARDRDARARIFRRNRLESRGRDGRLHHRLITVDTGTHNWLDFSLATDAQADLYERGRAAVEEEFDREPERTEEEGENE